MIPKYGYCPACRELFKWLGAPYNSAICFNKYHDKDYSPFLRPCWEIWVVKDWYKPPPKKLLLMRCKYCENRFICLTNGWTDEKG